ncbi:hypothetical protein ACOMHN_034967 [Nucella lapillus]
MASAHRERFMSEISTSSSDSLCLDLSNPCDTIGEVDSSKNLLNIDAKNGHCKGEKSSSSRCSLAVASLIISVVCLVGILLLFVCFHGSFLSGKKSEQEKVCMPCSQVNPSPLAEGESPLLRLLDIQVDSDGEPETCCASTPAQYATLFKLILKRQEQVKKLADILGNGNDTDDVKDDGNGVIGRRAVSAHLLTKPSPPSTDEKGNSMQQWKSPQDSPMSHVRGLQFHKNKLYVQKEGLYFVYCQILYNKAPPPKVMTPHAAYLAGLASHYVRRFSLLRPATSGLLLKARHTRMTGLDDRHSSYVGGLFFLHTGDELFVQVSVPGLVSHDPVASFFGLFKVGN